MVHREVWDGQFSVLAKDYRIVRYDRRGYGKSSSPKATFSNVEDLNHLFLQLKIDKAIVFGMSAGGGLVIDFALTHPEKVTAMVLVGAVVDGYGYSNHFITRGGHFNYADYAPPNDPVKLIRYFGMDDPYTIYSENRKAKEKYVKLLEANPQNVNFEQHSFSKPLDRPSARFLSEIKVPALIIVGEYDIPDVHAHAGVIETGIADSKRIILGKSGHLIPLEQPEAFNAAVLKFLYNLQFKAILKSEGVDPAVKFCRTKLEANPEVIIFEKREIHQLAYEYLTKSNIHEAIEMCSLYALEYPKSEYAFAMLGEAYLKNGQKDDAIISYKKSLEINPKYAKPKEMLEKIEKSK